MSFKLDKSLHTKYQKHGTLYCPYIIIIELREVPDEYGTDENLTAVQRNI